MPDVLNTELVDVLTNRLYVKINKKINMAHNLVQHDMTKHVKIYIHFLKKELESECICLLDVLNTKLVDVLTNRLYSQLFED